MKRAVIIFTRAPRPGQTKTRMMPHLTAVQCARLHTCFLKDIAGQCRGLGADILVSYTPKEGREELEQILGPAAGWFPQEGDSLGERMYRAIAQAFARGCGSCLLIGTDVPELKKESLEKAFAILEEKDAVFGRTGDGGYYLVGMKRPLREAFSLDAYGHGQVLEETLEEMREAGLAVGFTDTLEDMDTPEDLRGYRRRMVEDTDLKKPSQGDIWHGSAGSPSLSLSTTRAAPSNRCRASCGHSLDGARSSLWTEEAPTTPWRRSTLRSGSSTLPRGGPFR